MIRPMIAGACVGIGLLIAGRGLRPARNDAETCLRLLRPWDPAFIHSNRSEQSAASGSYSRSAQALAPLVHALSSSRLGPRPADLAITGRSSESHAIRQLVAAAWLGAVVLLLATFVEAVGIALPGPGPVLLAALAAAGGLSVPGLLLRSEAEEAREAMRGDLALFQELAVLVLAAGGGVDSALAMAAGSGDGRSWELLRGALTRAQVTRRPPAETLGELANEIDMVELAELAGTVALATTGGTRLRDSLAARAEAARSRALAHAQAQAAAGTERMTFPVVLLAGAFLGLVGFPAVATVMSSF